MKNLIATLLLISVFAFGQEKYNTISIGLTSGMLSEGGSLHGNSLPVFNIDIAKQLTPSLSFSTDFMFGFADGSGWYLGEEDFWYDSNFKSVSGLLSLYLLNLGALPRVNRNISLSLKGGFGFLDVNGDNQNGDLSNSSISIPTALELKYKISSNIQARASFSQVFPMGPGLDGIKRADEGVWDLGFRTINLGFAYTLGKNESSMEWINPVDVVSAKMTVVEKEMSNLTIDTDGDGVSDKFDKDNSTPLGVAVDGSGQPLDVDADGVPDYKDLDPFTSPGVAVDINGNELDDDKDGVPNSMDEEPNSPVGCTVNFQGRQIVGKGAFLPTVYFDVASSEVSYSNYQRLATVASVLKANPGYKLRVVGFADSVGSTESNYKLGLKRANAVIESLVNTFGIDLDRMIADSQGENNLLANEDQKMKFQVTSDGLMQTKNFKSLNRRVQFIIE